MRLLGFRFQALSSARRTPADLFHCRWMCYNRRAVERAPNLELAQVLRPSAQPASPPAVLSQSAQSQPAPLDDASRYCPVCSQRLESRRCKLICPVCGYYMSCADYY
jgi:hypothetical protein